MKRVRTWLFGSAVLVSLGLAPTALADPTRLPCDIYADDGGPCVAAHSTVRRLSSTYTGPLYQVRREGPGLGTTQDIWSVASGFANTAAQETFCGTRKCTISIIYDQSGRGNHLTKAPPGFSKRTGGKEANAKSCPITISGHNLYGEHNEMGVAYRNNQAVGTATGDNAETIYMVANGRYHSQGCCFEYGNVEKSSGDIREGTAETVYFGRYEINNKGDGDGPWVMADLAGGMWAGTSSPFAAAKSLNYKYVTGVVKGGPAGTRRLAVKNGNAQSGSLTKVFEGSRLGRWEVMRKEGGITLGADTQNENAGVGDFFEGVMTAHYSSDAADDAVQANIVSVYGQY
jgi:hypothetical protein